MYIEVEFIGSEIKNFLDLQLIIVKLIWTSVFCTLTELKFMKFKIWVSGVAIIQAKRQAWIVKDTVCFHQDWLGLPCLVQFLTRLGPYMCQTTVNFETLKDDRSFKLIV